MTIHEKTIIRHSVSFTQEDIDLIRHAAVSVYGDMDIKHLISYNDRGLARAITAINKALESVTYSSDLTVDDFKHVEMLVDILCAFEARFPEDPQSKKAEELSIFLIKAKKAFYSEM